MSRSNTKYNYNPDPRISANQLAEYTTATGVRRKSIIAGAKFPRTAVAARYKITRKGLADFLSDNTRPMTRLSDIRDDLSKRESRPSATEWVKNDCRLSRESVDAFEFAYNRLGLGRHKIQKAPKNLPNLVVNGVDVSVALDNIVQRKDRQKRDRVGGLILLFAKSEQSDRARQERCSMSATLGLLLCQENLANLGLPDPAICFGLDVFKGKLVRAPNSYKKRLANIEVSCEEIYQRWEHIDPPADYDGPPL